MNTEITQPDEKLKTFFSLAAYSYYDGSDVAQYPQFIISKDQIGYYTSLEKAEEQLKAYEIRSDHLYCFVVKEKALNQMEMTRSLSVRTYLADKTPFGLQTSDSNFSGKSKVYNNKFQVGDIVEVCGGGLDEQEIPVHLGIVMSVPGSPGYSGCKTTCYEVLYGEDELDGFFRQKSEIALFPPSMKVPVLLGKVLRYELKETLGRGF